jgi:DMSO reductase family type II enzyme molybdopterin subunit/DMSO reductase family type II enzyme chaperone
VYALLSVALRYPDAGLSGMLADGRFQAELGAALGGLLLPASSTAPARPTWDGAEPGATYTGLFDVGSAFGPPCSLYGGEYGGGRLGVLEDVLRFYRCFGLRLAPQARERPDHLATELEFLAWLAAAEAGARGQGPGANQTADRGGRPHPDPLPAGAGGDAASSYQAAARDFLAAHALPLAQAVAARLAGRAEPFYPALAQAAAAFCQADLARLAAGVGATSTGDQPDGLSPHPDPLPAGAGREEDPLPAGEGGDAAALPHRPIAASPDPAVGGPSTGPALSLSKGSGRAGRAAVALRNLYDAGDGQDPATYDLRSMRARPLAWDRVVKSSHLGNCWYQRACNYNLFVLDGVVLREEQAGNYPAPNDPGVPDPNPRGCQKGGCYAHRTYDPARLKYPLKRVGERGCGRWQRVSWDQALDEIADQLIDVLVADGPDAIFQPGGTHLYSQASEGMGANAFFEALGTPLPSPNVEIGDDHQGAAITAGKVVFADSADNWFHADLILVWGGNPAYTNVPNYHYIAEARYRGARVIAISPDYNASAVHADLWLPVAPGSDAALALSLCQVIVREGLFKAAFAREQTDLPLLVRADTGRLLREKDLKRGGREDVFYVWDRASGRVVEAPRKSLALNGIDPALEGSYTPQTLQGPVRVQPTFELLRAHLDARFMPEAAGRVTGVPAGLIEQVAREIAAAGGMVNISTSNWGKFYHGDLIERATILLFALTGNMGRKGASYNAFPFLFPDTALGALERHGKQLLVSAAGSDPRYAAWKEDGYTTEMILNEYTKQAVASGAIGLPSLVHFIHSGLLELAEQHPGWDPHLKRPIGEYMAEALDKGWQPAYPPPGKPPRAVIQAGGNMLRRGRATEQMLKTLLPKLKLLVSVDWRMSGTALYSDYVLPTTGWYERTSTSTLSSTQSPFVQVLDRAVEPLFDSLSDWTIFVRLGRAVARRARERGLVSYTDRGGNERRFDKLESAVTFGGLYDEDGEEDLARDCFINSGNAEPLSWEEVKERGIAAFTGLGTGVRSLGNACDIRPGEPIVPLTWHVQDKQPYPTLTRRLQFYIDHDWYIELDEHLPTHKDPPTVGGEYPLQLTGGHARWSIHSNWVDDRLMLQLQRGEPTLLMSVEDASARSIKDGEQVEVFNDISAFRVQAVVSPAVRPSQVIVYHAWENYQFPGWKHFKGVMASPPNPVELAGGYGHIRPDVFGFTAGQNDRDTRVQVRAGGTNGSPRA